MRQLERIPLITPDDVVYDGNGGMREWKSQAAAVTNFKLGFRLFAYPSQERRCAYCSHKIGDAARSDQDIDHFAPKSMYPQWTFKVDNLLLACIRCNRTQKGSFNTVDVPNEVYENCEFNIFHPYFHDPKEHFEGGYIDAQNPPSIPVGISPQGRATIELLDLVDPNLLSTLIDEFFASIHSELWVSRDLANVREERRRLQTEIDEQERAQKEKWIRGNTSMILQNIT